jgi:hypothetical protein
VGFDAGSCARRWTLGVARREGPQGTSMGLSASLRLMDHACTQGR